MNICIAYPNKQLSYSETFIKNQLDYVPHKKELSGGLWPYLDENKKSIFKFLMAFDFIRGVIKQLFPYLYKILYTKALVRFLKQHDIEVMCAHYGPTGTSVLDACISANVELVVHFHGYDASDNKTKSKFRELYIKLGQYAKRIIVVSKDMHKALLDLGVVAHFQVNPYGIDETCFSGANPAIAAPICVFVGRFTEKKAPHVTLKSFARVLKQVPDAKLIMVGSGELFDASVQLASNLNIADNVEFTGVKTSAEVASILKTARLFVQHSVISSTGDSEGTPNTILEASATGLPIVSTFHAGIKEAVVHQKTGFLVDEFDEIGMSNYMTLLLQNPDLAYTMGLEARQHILLNYNLEIQIKKLIEILNAN